MKFAVITDIHGNLEAFTQVMADIQTRKVDQIISLGDNIGYGADSEKIIQKIQEQDIVSIVGNHEMVIRDKKFLRCFKPDAKAALKIAVQSLSEDSLQYIRDLKLSLCIADCRFVHGFPPDSFRHYLHMISDSQFHETFAHMTESVCFVGHTHKLHIVCPEEKDIHFSKLETGSRFLLKETKYIINAGSVGQSRDDDPNAKYLLWDTKTRKLEVFSIPYDMKTAAEKIIKAKIPPLFARRIYKKKS